MVYRVVYLAKAYDIPLSLIVNSDQTGIHLVPTVGECTWESKGSKHIHVLSIEDKWQMTMVVFSFVERILLPLQVIFTSNMAWTLPLNNQRKVMCVTNVGFNLQ